jgi:hypothetical protein
MPCIRPEWRARVAITLDYEKTASLWYDATTGAVSLRQQKQRLLPERKQ